MRWTQAVFVGSLLQSCQASSAQSGSSEKLGETQIGSIPAASAAIGLRRKNICWDQTANSYEWSSDGQYLLASIPKDDYAAAKRAEDIAAVVSYLDQVALGILMYATDHEDNSVGPAQNG